MSGNKKEADRRGFCGGQPPPSVRPSTKVPLPPSPSGPFLLLLLPVLCLCPILFVSFLPAVGGQFDGQQQQQQMKHCTEADLLFQYSPCENNHRWLYAVPRSQAFLCSPESMPPVVHGLNCSVTCPAGHFLEMRVDKSSQHSQQCRVCQPGSFSLGDRVRYEQFTLGKLPEGFSIENSPDESWGFGGATQCPEGGGWSVEQGELNYRWTSCVSTLSISLHLTRTGFAEFQYQMSSRGDSRGLISFLQVRNAQCQSYGSPGNPLLNHQSRQPQQQKQKQQKQRAQTAEEQSAEGLDIRVQRLTMHKGQNLITWTVSANPMLSTRMEMIRLIRLDIFGLAFTPECSPCPPGTFSAQPGSQQCEPCPMDQFSGGKGATHCNICPQEMWAEPRSEYCRARPPCEPIDYFARPSGSCQSGAKGSGRQQRVVQYSRVLPPICREEASGEGAIKSQPEMGSADSCPPCGLGQFREKKTGKCQKCAESEVSAEGKECRPCEEGWVPERGLFLTNWDSLPEEAELNMECEFLAADDSPGECQISPSWISMGNRLESTRARMSGIALELSLHLRHGFYSSLHSGTHSPDNPLAHISVELEMHCRDASCQLYMVQEFAPELGILPEADKQLQVQVLALLNGTQPRRVLSFAVSDPRPRRLVIAFTRSGAMFGRDALADWATIHSLNVTNTGSAAEQRAIGVAHRCVPCPRREAGLCRPCPGGHYWAQADSSCRSCPPGTVLNLTAQAATILIHQSNASSSAPIPCSPCPPYFSRSADGFSCEFSGHFDLEVKGAKGGRNAASKMHFDLSAFRQSSLGARGVRVFARDGQSYAHLFNISLFADNPVICRDSMPSATVAVGAEDEQALFCRSAAIPVGNNGGAANGTTNEVIVSSTIISRQLALVSQVPQFGNFRLSDEQLEYAELSSSSSSNAQRPLDVHFFFAPLPGGNNVVRSPSCPNGSVGALTIRCDPTATGRPIVRLSRHCPDGTCDGCLYHAIVESAHGCPLCRSEDFKEIRGECVDSQQPVHSIPAKHCVLSGAQAQQRMEPCKSVLSPAVGLLLALALILILFLVLAIAAIYRRNRTLEYRYMRLIEGGKDTDQRGVRSCALDSDEGSEEQDEEEQEVLDSSRSRVLFSVKRGAARKGQKSGRGRAEERAEFIAEEDESD